MLCLGLACGALGMAILSQPDPREPERVVERFLEALTIQDESRASGLVIGGPVINQEAGKVFPGEAVEIPGIRARTEKLDGSKSTVVGTVRGEGGEVSRTFELAYSRGVGWRIRKIEGMPIDVRSLQKELRIVRDAEGREFLDQASLKRDLERMWGSEYGAAGGERRPQIATQPEDARGTRF